MKAVGMLMSDDGKSKELSLSTAFLVSDQFILTARHNVANSHTFERYKRFTFYPGLHGHIKDAEHYSIATDETGQPIMFYPQIKGAFFDYAFLKLSEPCKDREYLKMGVNFSPKEGDSVRVVAYPQKEESFKNRFVLQESVSCPITHVEKGVLYYTQEGFRKGYSGSAAMYEWKNQWWVVGVHSG